MPAGSRSSGFRTGGRQAYLAALAGRYRPEIRRLRAKLRRTRLRAGSAKIQAEIDRLESEWERARRDAGGACF